MTEVLKCSTCGGLIIEGPVVAGQFVPVDEITTFCQCGHNVTFLAEHKTDNPTVTPLELLAMATKEVQSNPKIKRALVFLVQEDNGDKVTYDTFRCGLKWEQEVSLLDWAHYKCLTRQND